VVLTANWLSTVAGTIAVGGFGESSHLRGLQTETVRRLTLMTLDGDMHTVERGDPLFDYSMAGRGQLGVMTELTVETIRRPWTLTARAVLWSRLEDFVEDAKIIAEDGRFEFFRGFARWDRRATVFGLAGNFLAEGQLDASLFADLRCELGPLDRRDYYQMQTDPSPLVDWTRTWPCLEFVLPLPRGTDLWRRIRKRVMREGIDRYIRPGSAVMVMSRARNHYPLVPFAEADYNLVVVLRPSMPPGKARDAVDFLLRLRSDILRAGGRIYLMSLEPPDGDLGLPEQFGEAYRRLLELKQRVDPKGLLNPGLLNPGRSA
jgi:FAD/FMN-containing dehydrogenase